MLSTEPVITVSPEKTTRYRLKVQTVKGLVDYTDIVVHVMDVLECQFDYSTGDIVSQYGVLLTKNQVLSRNWNTNGQAAVTVVDFTQSEPMITCSKTGGVIFRSQCFVPDGSETLIASLWIDGLKGVQLYNNKAVVNETEYQFSATAQYYTFEVAAVFQPDSELWRFSLSVSDTKTQNLIFEHSEDVAIGSVDSEISLYLIGSSIAKAGFYYGTNGDPIPVIQRSTLSVPVGGRVVLDASESYDPDGDALSFNWLYKLYSESRFKKLYKNDDTITETVSQSTVYRVQVSDFEATVDKDVIVTNYTVQQLDDYAYEIKAVLDDVADLYSYQWSASDDTLSSTDRTVVVQPLGDIVYTCLITELSTGETSAITVSLSGVLRIIHARNTLTGEYQEIKVYPDTRLLTRYIECKVDGYQGYLAVGDLSSPKRSMLKCAVSGDVYSILLHI